MPHTTKIIFKREGYFYSAYDDSAQILSELFGYRLIANASRPKTGVPVSGAKTIALKLFSKGIEFSFVDKDGNEIDVMNEPAPERKPKAVKEKSAEAQPIGDDGALKEKYAKAKDFIDAIIAGISAVNQNPSDGFLETFAFISQTLGKLSGEQIKKKREAKSAFCVTDKLLDGYEYGEKPIPLSAFVEKINRLSDLEHMYKLKFSSVSEWLLKEGYLCEQPDGEGETVKRPTEQGENAGISWETRTSPFGKEYTVAVYDKNAQKFVLDNLRSIVKE